MTARPGGALLASKKDGKHASRTDLCLTIECPVCGDVVATVISSHTLSHFPEVFDCAYTSIGMALCRRCHVSRDWRHMCAIQTISG